MDYAKNFKFSDMLLRTISFSIYFFVAGFIGKLAILLSSPVWTFILKDGSDLRDAIIYAVTAFCMLASISFFSAREGYSDTECMRFSYLRTIISYIFAAAIFGGICYLAGVLYRADEVIEYFLTPYFPPREIAQYILAVELISEIAGYLPETDIAVFSAVIIVDTIMMTIFYITGRYIWIRRQKTKIKKLLRESYFSQDAPP